MVVNRQELHKAQPTVKRQSNRNRQQVQVCVNPVVFHRFISTTMTFETKNMDFFALFFELFEWQWNFHKKVIHNFQETVNTFKLKFNIKNLTNL